MLRPQKWMEPARDVIHLAASHQDQVITLPDYAELWAASDYCPNGGMLVGERAWTLQVHPEFSPALSDSLLATRIALFGEEEVAAARATLTVTSLDQDLVARWISTFFHE
mgnify:FL=1